MNALRIKTKNKHKIIIKFGLSGKNLIKLDKRLSKALVCTTPCPRINRHKTVIKEVLLNPFRIA